MALDNRLCALVVIFVFVAIASGPVSARAASAREVVEELASQTSAYLKAKDQEGVRIGRVTGPELSSCSMKLERLLKKTFADRGLARPRGLVVEMDCSVPDGRFAARLRLMMRDRNGRPVAEFNELEIAGTIDDADDVSLLLGTTHSSLAKDLNSVRAAAAVSRPAFAVKGQTQSAISADAATPYRLELLVRRAGKRDFETCRVEDRSGLAHAPLRADDEYALRIYNDSDFDCAVRVAVDGFHTFEFSEDPKSKGAGRWMIARKSMLFLRGWHRSEKDVESFRADRLPAGGSRTDQQTGTVTALFYAAWKSGDPTPEIEPNQSRCAKPIRLPTMRRTLVRSYEVREPGRRAVVEIHSERLESVECSLGPTLQAALSIRYDRPAVDAGSAPRSEGPDNEFEPTGSVAEPEC